MLCSVLNLALPYFNMQVPLGLLFKSENINEEMIDILQELHNKYLPVDRDVINGEEVVSRTKKKERNFISPSFTETYTLIIS